jgi:hypothetical protein
MQRTLSLIERELVIALVGTDTWRVKEENIRRGVLDDMGVPRHGTMMADDGEVTLYVGDDLPILLHEYGHGTHALKYPESIDWPLWKAEAFAYLSDMRAMKRKGLLTAAQRADFARHIRSGRREGHDYHRAGMRLAFRAVFKHFRPKLQEAHVVSAEKAED